jgi:hypothetical protein
MVVHKFESKQIVEALIRNYTLISLIECRNQQYNLNKHQ